MKHLVILSAMTAGLTAFADTNTAVAGHCDCYGYSCGPSISSYSYSSPRSSYYYDNNDYYYRPTYRSRSYYSSPGFGYSSPRFSYDSPRFSFSFGSSRFGSSRFGRYGGHRGSHSGHHRGHHGGHHGGHRGGHH